MLSAVPAFLAFSVIPFGPMVSIFGHETPLQLTDLPVGVLYRPRLRVARRVRDRAVRLVVRLDVPAAGRLRSAAQMISYEVAMGLSLVAVFLYAGTLSTSGIVAAQQTTGTSCCCCPRS